MSLPVLLRAAAKADLREQFEALEEKQPLLGVRLLFDVREVIANIETMPEMYGTVWRRVRAAVVRRFPCVVYYIVCDDHSEVIAVFHGARHSDVWRSRT